MVDNAVSKVYKVYIVSCGIFQPELQEVLTQIIDEGILNCKVEVVYLAAGLHVNLDDLIKSVLKTVSSLKDSRVVLLYGSKCHPELDEVLKNCSAVRFAQANCIELILGKKMEELDKETKKFYLSPGWLKNWKEIFKERLQWDECDARQNFGSYDKIILLDTGVCEFKDEQILEFFEYTQVPIEVKNVDLKIFKETIIEAIQKALALG
ncbi:DUF1638 domain-containing protein [Calderihabitans maritimus]|uniref:DUF1638 domain-containing protein n=1 Tax=Calderihabitans maritimus TaxID=1246530 RepID=A0A1Z5HVA4_9FIRM|nr:DUF1638 domain-containing protein [Calderihabitans maritimus]GAW93466.1 hypothetical protein Desmer_1407 [Calderihabitans maritimus]